MLYQTGGFLRRRFHKGEVGGANKQVFLCRKVLHLWVSVRRQPTFAAAAVAEIHITSRKVSVLHVVTALLLACANSIGRRKHTDLRPETGYDLSRNGYKAPSTRYT